MKTLKGLVLTLIATFTLVGCGGGGDGGGNNGNTQSSSPAVLYVNKNGVYRTYPFTTSTTYAQTSSSGYFVYGPVFNFGSYLGPAPRIEWSGRNLGYIQGYVLPTSGILDAISITSDDLWFSVQNANYDFSKSPPTLDPSNLVVGIFSNALSSVVIGGPSDDITFFFATTIEVDLQGGNDTLEFSQNFSMYRFQRVTGQQSAVTVSRSDLVGQTLIKNVEQFKFADGIKTLAQIQATIP